MMNTRRYLIVVLASLLVPLFVFSAEEPDSRPVESTTVRRASRRSFYTKPQTMTADHFRRQEEGPGPSFWNWHDKDAVTPVKHQGDTQGCTVYCLSSQFESAMILRHNLPRYAFDLSEADLVTLTGTADGGNAMTVVSYLTQNPMAMNAIPDVGSLPVPNRLTQWEILSFERALSSEELREYLMDKGPLYTDVYFGEPGDDAREFVRNEYDGRSAIGAFIPQDNGEEPEPIVFPQVTHSVLLVGWDDNYLPPPPSTDEDLEWMNQINLDAGLQVFIVKNSWGLDWADRGYGYILPGHLNLGEFTSIVTDWKRPRKQENVMSFDNGYNLNIGYSEQPDSAYGLVEFPMGDAGQNSVYVFGFDIWLPAQAGVQFELYDRFDHIYQKIDEGSLIASQSGQFPRAGYYSVDLSQPVSVDSHRDEGGETVSNNVYLKYKVTLDPDGEDDVYPLLSYIIDIPERKYTSFVSKNGEDWFCINQDFFKYQWGDLAVRLRYSPLRTSIFTPHWDKYR